MPPSKETQRESRISQKVCVPQTKETQRESYILQGLVCLRLKKHSVNHVFYEGLCASE